MQTLAEVIDAFGYAELAAALGKPSGTVSSWKTRGILPSAYWEDVVAEAKRRSIKGVNLKVLATLEANRKKSVSRPTATQPGAA